MAERHPRTPAASDSVGLLGLAGIAWEWAMRLTQAGQALAVHEVDGARLDRFHRASTGKDTLAWNGLRGLDIVLLAPGHDHADDLLGPAGTGLAPGAIAVQLGPDEPARTRTLGQTLARQGVALIDAPLCGVPGCHDAYAICCGTDDDAALERVLPLLRMLCPTVLAAGKLGHGQAMRLLEAHVHDALLTAAAEALLIGERIGLPAKGLCQRVAALSGRDFDVSTLQEASGGPPSFNAGFALGLFARGDAPAFAPPRHNAGLTRLLIEFSTPIPNQETK